MVGGKKGQSEQSRHCPCFFGGGGGSGGCMGNGGQNQPISPLAFSLLIPLQ